MRLGIVGLASRFWPSALAQRARQIPGVELRAAADLGRSTAELQATLGTNAAAFAERFGVRLYRDPTEMIAEEKLEAVFLCAETARQVEYAEVACQAGVDLYIAKPMAATLAAADRIVRAAREAGVIASTGNTERFDGALREAHRLVRSGAIGDVLMIRALHQHGNISSFGPDDWYWQPEHGGPELSLIWYVADVIRWFADAPVTRVYAEYDNFASPDSPFMDNGKAILRFANRAIGSFDVYFSVAGFQMPRWEIEVVGSRGAIRTQQSAYEGTVFTAEGPRSFYRNQNDVLLAELRAWLDCCRERRSPEITLEHAREILAISLACRQSNQEHRPIELAC